MRCISPLTIRPKATTTLQKLARKASIEVPCGKCGNCLSKKANDWSFRLTQEEKGAKSAYFLTLTYADEYFLEYGAMEDYPSLQKTDVQLFIKRLRKHQNKKHKDLKIKYYAIGEYGDKNGRPHYHLIIFNIHHETMVQIHKIWTLGNVHVGQCNRQTINYCTYYLFKKMENKKKIYFSDERTSTLPLHRTSDLIMSKIKNIIATTQPSSRTKMVKWLDYLTTTNQNFGIRSNFDKYKKNIQ